MVKNERAIENRSRMDRCSCVDRCMLDLRMIVVIYYVLVFLLSAAGFTMCVLSTERESKRQGALLMLSSWLAHVMLLAANSIGRNEMKHAGDTCCFTSQDIVKTSQTKDQIDKKAIGRFRTEIDLFYEKLAIVLWTMLLLEIDTDIPIITTCQSVCQSAPLGDFNLAGKLAVIPMFAMNTLSTATCIFLAYRESQEPKKASIQTSAFSWN